jgi:hypothetical protein
MIVSMVRSLESRLHPVGLTKSLRRIRLEEIVKNAGGSQSSGIM